jgi:formylmethanofuran dehydrogenase subunit E
MPYESPLTTDISKMDLSEVTEMLSAYQEENTTRAFKAMWYDEDTIPTLNQESGYCFLTNSDYQVAMMNEGMLSMFINCGECGREEFEQEWDLENGKTTCEGCQEIVKQLKECEQ